MRAIRDQIGMRQDKLAAKVGLSQAAISQFENGQRQPTPANIDAIANALGVARTDLVAQKGGFERRMLMRNMKGLTPSSLEELGKYAEYLKHREQESG